MPGKVGKGINERRLKKLLREMVDIYSPSGKENEILEYAQGHLMSKGIPVLRQQVDENRYNLIVYPGGRMPEIVFLGHLDTVAAFDLEKFESRQSSGEIFGLGSADMKGGCAAMIEAFTAFFQQKGCLPPAALALVVGEEEEGDGTRALAKEYEFPWAVVAEPTNMTVCLRHYGYIEAEIKTFGKRRHASYSDYKHNAIFDMLNILLRLTDYLDKSGRDLIYNIRDVHSSDSGFAVPDRCLSQLDIHLPPGAPIKTVISEIKQIILSHGKAAGNYRHEVNFPTTNKGYTIPDRGKAVSLIKKSCINNGIDWDPGYFRSHSDANILWDAGTKPLIFGPGHLAKAHSNNESVPIDQVFRASRVYLDILRGMWRNKA